MDYRLGCKDVVSISSVCDEEIAQTIRYSDYIRNESLKRTWSIPSMPYKNSKWKNKYYDHFRKQIISELNLNWR